MKSKNIIDTEDKLTELGVFASATQLIPEDSLLIVVRSGILRHSIPVAINLVPVTLNQDMKAMICNCLMKVSYLYFLIFGMQKDFLPLWSKQGCTVESIEMTYFFNMKIPLPPLDEQERIVDFVEMKSGYLNDQSEKVKAVIGKLKEYRAALITQAVTGQIDVRGLVDV